MHYGDARAGSASRDNNERAVATRVDASHACAITKVIVEREIFPATMGMTAGKRPEALGRFLQRTVVQGLMTYGIIDQING